jgi:hypothetical protein
VSGDFFCGVPAGAGLYLLKAVLHNWDDARCVQLLQHCRAALAPSARLVVIERLLPEQAQDSPAARAAVRSDLNMLVGLGGRERSAAQFAALLAAAGLALRRVVPLAGEFALLEAGTD